MPRMIDFHVGQRLRQRRSFLSLTQQELADLVGVTFQQIQKYESGENRIAASRLFELAAALRVSVDFFFTGLSNRTARAAGPSHKLLSNRETLDLVRSFYGISRQNRRHFLDLIRSLANGEAGPLSDMQDTGIAHGPLLKAS